MAFSATVVAPQHTPVDVKFSHGKHIIVAPGGKQTYDLTGDEIGLVKARIASVHKERYPEYRDQDVHDWTVFLESIQEAHGGIEKIGGVICKEIDDFTPPEGSKAHKRLVELGMIDPPKMPAPKKAESKPAAESKSNTKSSRGGRKRKSSK